MRDIEVQLRAALRRKDAPAGLAGRIMAKVEGRRSGVRWLAIAAAVLVMTAAGWQYHAERSRRMAAENSAQQLEMALRIVADRLTKLERQVRGTGTRVIHLQADRQEENLQ